MYRNVRRAGALCSATALAAGCWLSGGSTSEVVTRVVGPDLRASAPGAMHLPIDEFTRSVSDERTIDEAHAALVSRCVARFGLVPPLPPRTGTVGPAGRAERRYGLLDRRSAARNGYRLGAGPATSSPPAPPVLTGALELVLTGGPPAGPSTASATAAEASAPAVLRGRPVPVGGCLGEAGAVLGPCELDTAGLVMRIDHESWTRSRAARTVQRATGAWAACMRAVGHDYTDPISVTDDPAFRSPRLSAREISVAIADIDCKSESHVVREWHAQDVAWQSRLIQQHRAELARLRADQDHQLVVAREVLDGVGPSLPAP